MEDKTDELLDSIKDLIQEIKDIKGKIQDTLENEVLPILEKNHEEIDKLLAERTASL